MDDLFSEARKKISRARYKGTGVAMSRSEAMALLEKIERLRAEKAELHEALSDMWAEASGAPKSCGHDFACVCPGEEAKAALAKEHGDTEA